MNSPFRPLAPMFSHRFSYLFWSLFTLVLKSFLTFLIGHLFAFWNLDIFTLLVGNLLALLSIGIVNLTFFCVGGMALFLTLWGADLFVGSVAMWLLQALAFLLKLVVDKDIFIGSAELAFLQLSLDRPYDWLRMADFVRNVPTGLLRDCDAFRNLNILALFLWNFLTYILLDIVADFLRDLVTLLPMVGWGAI